jgi:pimeloyl-ACP methyl ester carboxylesterase
VSRIRIGFGALLLLTQLALFAQPAPATHPQDTSPHTVQFIPVDQDVKLEVLNWGGHGRALIFLAGLGFDAHVYDTFAPKFVSSYHVYGITRRGFGASSTPTPDCQNYSADRLGDDVLAVMDALKIERPVLIGHSLGGEELSSIGTRYPDRVAGLIYLDAGYGYAYYDPDATDSDPAVDAAVLRHELEDLLNPVSFGEHKRQIEHTLNVTLPRVQRDLQQVQKQLADIPDDKPMPPMPPFIQYAAAIQRGVQAYSGVKVPALAIFALPHKISEDGMTPEAHAARVADDLSRTGAQVNAFQKGNPSARIVRLPNADHFVFRSNEEDVIKEMNSFLATLP